MAQGDFEVFDQFMVNLGKGPDIGHDFGTTPNTIKLAIVDSTTAPTKTTADPCWGAGGTTNFSTWEVATTANYVTGGNECATASVTLTADRAEFDWGDPTAWSAHASGDADAKWGILYDETTTNNNCIGFVDLGTAFDMSSGTLTVTFGAPAFYIDQAP